MTDSADSTELLESLEDGVLTLTLNRPHDLNALNTALMRRLNEAVQRAAHNGEVGCVVLTGAGRAFCAGGDMKAASKARADAVAAKAETPKPETPRRPPQTLEARIAWLRRSMEAARLLHEMPKPTIAMVNGPCAGAGMSLAGACDLRFAGQSARFTTAFAKAGISGDYGGSWFWTRILGTARARELYFLNEKIEAADALAAGIVSAVHPDGQLAEKTMEVARRLAAGSAATYGYMKRSLNAAESGRLEEVFDMEAVNTVLSRQAWVAARS
ncbi:enoyl-CoA hydratase-related protein [Phenylobacterium sp.]|jgi:2-(1,2-epoxy-1,2-dihydrophenyl)acetyl-CoA isomerase|uniref:enoyl-CoA hydratase-related protein n=1 Tax=Phenylobacterium sp. TaxID=1871053 RepID=UPI002F4280A7